MPRLRTREISSAPGTCRRCGAVCTLTVRETRYARRWSDLLARAFDPAVTRTATCEACSTTYPVRATDVTAVAAARRRDALDAPTSRDWAYPPVGDRRAEEPAAAHR